MVLRSIQLISIILLIAGFMFVVDVVSPATPTPQAIRDGAYVLLILSLALAFICRDVSLSRLLQDRNPFLSAETPSNAPCKLTIAIYTLRC